MNIISSPGGSVDPNRPRQGIRDMALAGFKNMLIEYGAYCSGWELEYFGKEELVKHKTTKEWISEHPELLYSYMQPVIDCCSAEGLAFTVATAPKLNRDTKRDDIYDVLMKLNNECIHVCGKLGCRYIIIEPYFAGVKLADEWKINREYYLCMAEVAKEHNITILLKNLCKEVNGRLTRGICSDPHEAAEWIDELNKEAGVELFGFCMDVGICNLCGQDMREFAVALGSRIKAVIVRDCDGETDTAMLPFTAVGQGQSKTDWLNLIRGLREINFDGELVFDVSDTACVFSPILKAQFMQLAKIVADYIKWQIEIESFLKKYDKRVLFGAGNMCRNYMKCYGEEYPPLYTCDNNSALWGTMFEGLEVKNPEELKKLPEDCAIFICNIYYREIEKQLKDMGLENPIEFFNDEYMPSFYVNRLEEIKD